MLENYDAKKVIVFKYRPKKHYRRKNGHRQPMTRFLVTKVVKGVSARAGADQRRRARAISFSRTIDRRRRARATRGNHQKLSTSRNHSFPSRRGF